MIAVQKHGAFYFDGYKSATCPTCQCEFHFNHESCTPVGQLSQSNSKPGWVVGCPECKTIVHVQKKEATP